LSAKAGAAGRGNKSNGKRGPAASEIAIIDSFRKKQGHFERPQRVLAEELKIPLSTLNAAIRRLEGRKLLRRDKKASN
jgi:DNA-binding MarR family transcriptional regulator